jgi:hypothetical protein
MTMTSSTKFLAAISIAAIVLSTGVTAKPKKAKIAAPQSAPVPTPPVRVPGYAILELENGNRDTVRIAEGESRATLPNIMANDVDFVTVVGANTVVILYEQPNFRGHSLTLRCGNYELLEKPRNDIESVQVRYVKTPVAACEGSKEQPVQYKTWSR